jgi:hypothetical protein
MIENLEIYGLRFIVNFIAIVIIARLIYYPRHSNKEFLFTFLLFNIIVFVLVFFMLSSNADMSIGFGLFALFSILRYRTNHMPIKEMGYLFLSLALGLLNAFASLDYSIYLLIIVNLAMVLLIYVIDRPSGLKHENMKEIVLDNLALINTNKREELLLDLKQKIGIPFHRVEIKSIDFFKETAKINAFYYSTFIEKSSIQDNDDF